MTTLKKPVARLTRSTLGPFFGPDRDKRLVVSFVPGDGADDLIQIRPERSRRVETLTLAAVYRYALTCRVNCAQLAKAREKKAAKERRRAENRLRREARADLRQHSSAVAVPAVGGGR